MNDFDLNGDGMVNEEEFNSGIQIDQWKNRRNMAYICLYTSIAVLAMCFFLAVVDPTVLHALEEVEGLIITIVVALMGTVGAYFGAKTWSDIAAVSVGKIKR